MENTTNEIMKLITDKMLADGASGDKIAQVEICIQYLGNPEFRQRLNDFVFSQTYRPNK